MEALVVDTTARHALEAKRADVLVLFCAVKTD